MTESSPGSPVATGAPTMGWWWFAALFVAACALLSVNLGAPALSNDEAVYLYWVSHPWGAMFGLVAGDNYPPLYFVLLKAWVGVAGMGEAAARLSSIPFAIATLGLFAWWVRRFLSRQAATLAFALLALSPFFLFLSRLTKYFAVFGLLAFAATALLWALASPVARNRPLREARGMTLAWAAASLLLLWTHYLGAAVWVGMGAWLVAGALRHGSPRFRGLIVVMAIAFLGFVPRFGALALQVRAAAGPGGEAPSAGVARGAAQAGYTLFTFAVGHTLEASHLLLAGLGVGAFCLALGFGAFAVAGTRHDSPTRDAATVRYCGFMLLAQGGCAWLIVSRFLGGLHALAFPERLAFLLPLVLVVAAHGLMRMRPRVRLVTLAAWVVPVAWSLVSMVTLRENNVWDYLAPWRDIARDVRALPAPRAVVFDNWHLGSRGWYYLQPDAVPFVALRQAAETGELGEACAAALASRPAGVALVRSARDTSPDGHAGRTQGILEANLGPPGRERSYLRDSEAMLRLKRTLRRGSGVETHEGKIRVLEWFPGRADGVTSPPD